MDRTKAKQLAGGITGVVILTIIVLYSVGAISEQACIIMFFSIIAAYLGVDYLINRNTGMAKNFLKIAKKQSLFCTVGAAHLPGEQGVINHLRKAGLTVEPVVFKWKEE